LLALAAAGCSGQGSASAHRAPSGRPTSAPAPVTEYLAQDRFTVTFSGQTLQAAKAAGINLPVLAGHALGHINALLPGPKTTITVSYAPAGKLIPQTGTDGATGRNGIITVVFGSTRQVSVGKAVSAWLPRTLSHEVDHSVRILAGPGFGQSLLQQIISEGISSVFDEAAFPGPPNPWDRAISPGQECALWRTATPRLGNPGLYDLWMFGGDGVPHWTGLTIGYDIVTDYRDRHPQVSWPALTAMSAAAILAGSHYQPCRS
jgi:Predicted Zn-dependent protease (DUF2268)